VQRIPVWVYARDPISQAGIASALRGRPEVWVNDSADVDGAAVALVVADEVDEETLRVMRAVQRNGCPRVVLVLSSIDDAALLSAVETGAVGVVRRAEATPERLSTAVASAAAGDGSVPPDLLGRLLGQVRQLSETVLAPRGLTLAGLALREIEVLRLVADGLDTSEIAHSLNYSERTVKNVIHDVVTRLQLRNRSHAVAYAVRQGLI
jgi:DNA-binding NarL/FixJ family response regulator